jgi:hypothetical protein
MRLLLMWFVLVEVIVMFIAIALKNESVILSSVTLMFLAGAIALAITIGKEANK